MQTKELNAGCNFVYKIIFISACLSAAWMTGCDDSSDIDTPESQCTSNQDCAGRVDGKTQCDTASGECVTPAAQPGTCGDGKLDAGESCDTKDLNGKSCASYPEFIGGTLACTASCEFDKTGCNQCTNDNLTKCASGEICSNGHCAPQPVYKVVISQIYPGGGNSGAEYNTRYIELLNIDEGEVDISGWSVQYSGSNKDTISSNCTLPSKVKLPKGGYYLISLGLGTNGNVLPVTADHTCNKINPAAANGKFYLVNNDKQLETAKPTSGYVDAVGYGSANWAEGSAMTTLSAKKAGLRKDGGCVDTNDNSKDFETGTPNPRNSASAANKCDGSTSVVTCGDNKAEGNEVCDGSDLRGKSCTDFDGYSGGTLKFKNCAFDKSACITKQDEKCHDGDVECDEANLSLKTCVGGKWQSEKCPDDKPYCKTGNEACTMVKEDDTCDPNKFVPFIYYDSYHDGYELYHCAYIHIYYETDVDYGVIKKESCGGISNKCIKAKDGSGYLLPHGDDKSTSCLNSEKGHTSVHTTEGDYTYKNGRWVDISYSWCEECKLTEEGELYNLLIPANYTMGVAWTTTGGGQTKQGIGPVSCTLRPAN